MQGVKETVHLKVIVQGSSLMQQGYVWNISEPGKLEKRDGLSLGLEQGSVNGTRLMDHGRRHARKS